MVLYAAVNIRVSELQGISSTIFRNKNKPISTVVDETQTYNRYIMIVLICRRNQTQTWSTWQGH